MPDEARVYFRDVKPYEAPADLAELRGPATGRLELPRTVYWGPSSSVDLAVPGDVVRAYQAALQEATALEQCALLSRERLVAVWPELALPPRVRALWEGRFPELASAA